MAITKSAKKAIRAAARKRVFNVRRSRAMTAATKKARAAMSPETLSAAYQAIDKAAKRGIIKKNTAARKKSRLAALVKRGSSKTA
jgi:small subunit ribosomal protein S20